MAYVKNTWVDQKVERPKTYNYTNNDDGSMTLIDSFGDVEELGTPVNADNMNHIEDGLANVGMWQYNTSFTYEKGDAVIAIEDDKFVLYKSLKDQNKGNALTNEDYWEKSELGGGGADGLDLATVVCMPFGVDESENKYRYLNGQVLIQEQFPDFTKKVKSWQSTRANLFTTETNWQAEKTASVLGQCGKFVVDDTAGTIRLPLVININGLTDLANCGVIKNESLPNVTGHIQNVGVQYENLSYSGAFKNSVDLGRPNNWAMYDPNVNWAKLVNVQFSASSSSATYQDNAPVQQESIQYPYVIVVNTGVEEAERPINNYQVNNVYSYGMSTYYKGTMNNNSWLRSAGQWNKGTVYNGVYEWAVGKLNEKVYDPSKFTIVGSPTITDDGIASGFSTSNYLEIPFDVTKPFTIKFKFQQTASSTQNTGVLGGLSSWQNLFVSTGDSTRFWLRTTNPNVTDTGSTEKTLVIENVQPNTNYTAYLTWDGNAYTFGVEGVAEKTYSSTYPLKLNNEKLFYFGKFRQLTEGSIDLKSFSITVDGEEAFSGSKIVQADGFKKSTDSDITDYDWVINTEEQTFRLPLKNGQEGVFDNDTVPSGYNLYYYIGDTLQNADLINIARLGESLSGKTDKAQAAHASMPSDKYTDLTLGSSGTTYTAPADGYFHLRKHSNNVNQFIGLYNQNEANLASEVCCPLNNMDSAIFLPVRKGDTVSCYYDMGGKTDGFRFIYAEGAK